MDAQRSHRSSHDSEWVDGHRMRLILGEDAPAILGTKQDIWVSALRHNEREPSELVEIFRTLRHLNLAVWRRTPPEDFERISQHNERGPESLGTMLRLLAGHDLSHTAQITRYIEAIQQQEECRQSASIPVVRPPSHYRSHGALSALGSIPIRSFTADRMRCLQPRYRSVV